jgi:polysaccharide pyruvyl transferase CsaB
MAKNRPVLIAGFYGFGNLGDEAIRTALLRKLETEGLMYPLTLVQSPQRDDQVDRNSPLAIFSALRRSSALVFGGGGLLQNRTSNRSLGYYLSLILLARLARRPVFLLGQGIGPINGTLARTATRIVLSRVGYRGCRDRGSLKIIKKMGLSGSLDGDLFLLSPPMDKPAKTPPDRPIRIILSLKGGNTCQGTNFIARMVNLINGLRPHTTASFIFLPFFPPEDLGVARAIVKNLNFSCQLIIPGTIEEATEVIGTADLLISSRLHPLEFALRAGTPMLAVAEDPKIERFVEEIIITTGLQIPCVSFPTPEVILLLLAAPPRREYLQGIYRKRHEITQEALAGFLDKFKGDLRGQDG